MQPEDPPPTEPAPPQRKRPSLAERPPSTGCHDLWVGGFLGVVIFVVNAFVALSACGGIVIEGPAHFSPASRLFLRVVVALHILGAVVMVAFVRRASRAGRLFTWTTVVLTCAICALLDTACANT